MLLEDLLKLFRNKPSVGIVHARVAPVLSLLDVLHVNGELERWSLLVLRHGLGSKEAVDEEGAEGGERDAGPDRAEPCSRREKLKAAYSMRRPKAI